MPRLTVQSSSVQTVGITLPKKETSIVIKKPGMRSSNPILRLTIAQRRIATFLSVAHAADSVDGKTTLSDISEDNIKEKTYRSYRWNDNKIMNYKKVDEVVEIDVGLR